MKLSLKQINILLFLLFLFLNYCQPIISDDLVRVNVSALYNHTILSCLYNDYLYWTGRMTAQWLVYIFFNIQYEPLLMAVFNVVNSLLLVSFINLLYIIVVKDKQKRNNNLFFLLLLFFLAMILKTGFLKATIWKTVGLQYFWGLWFCLWLYYNQFIGDTEKRLQNGFLLFVSGLFIGLYNEIFFAIIFIFLSAYIINEKFVSQNKVGKNIFAYYIGNFIGGVILCLAPGNYVRKAEVTHQFIPPQNSKLVLMLDSYLGMKHFLILFIIGFILLALDKKIIMVTRLIYLLALISMLLVFLPIADVKITDRMLMVQYTILTVIILQNLLSCKKVQQLADKFNWLFMIGNLSILLLFTISYFLLWQFNIKRDQQIDNYIQANVKHPVFDSYNSKFLRFVYFDDIVKDKSSWKNKEFATRYGFNDVTVNQ